MSRRSSTTEDGAGLNLFIDARDEEHYVEGHIPGAIQCDPYQIERYLQNTMDRVNGVERIIVYCNGGECETASSCAGSWSRPACSRHPASLPGAGRSGRPGTCPLRRGGTSDGCRPVTVASSG